jgi:hypothetical protein
VGGTERLAKEVHTFHGVVVVVVVVVVMAVVIAECMMDLEEGGRGVEFKEKEDIEERKERG